MSELSRKEFFELLIKELKERLSREARFKFKTCHFESNLYESLLSISSISGDRKKRGYSFSFCLSDDMLNEGRIQLVCFSNSTHGVPGEPVDFSMNDEDFLDKVVDHILRYKKRRRKDD